MDHADIIKAVSGLLRAGILKLEGDRYYLIKDYEKWVSTDGDNSVDKGWWQNTTGGKIPPKVVANYHHLPPDINKVVKDIKDNMCVSDLFETFWKAYPRKVAKVAAAKVWKRLNPDLPLFESILRSVKAWSETDQWHKDGKQYIPHPATFLTQRRWEDEMPERSTKFSPETAESLRRRMEEAKRKQRELMEKIGEERQAKFKSRAT